MAGATQGTEGSARGGSGAGEDTMAAEIHHVQVAIPAGGEERARGFYGGLLGFAELPKPANLARRGGVWFGTGNLDLHLGVDPAFRPATKAHIAYRVADLPALRRRLAEAGHTPVDDEPLPGYDRFYVDDPFGNRVELLEELCVVSTGR
ncbi:MAG: hypothetical protein AVDCRST_MAG19-3557 [uncultured Thermomicrobiales bacterium]|uniref:VOC domain-containing protein n=1 Tax=uncultured Thermomicrobiales bacterium TaxID=1645740 RepID=A0A6J4VGB9_9BACT|nr:MAG: hypothetical protein AVDCRST_MAG19-3557 [uncultured Thermomicrobiales bacterium]